MYEKYMNNLNKDLSELTDALYKLDNMQRPIKTQRQEVWDNFFNKRKEHDKELVEELKKEDDFYPKLMDLLK